MPTACFFARAERTLPLVVLGDATRSAAHLHLAPGDGDPLVARAVEPSQAEAVAAVQVDVLAVREPPATLVVGRAVRVADVAVRVDGAELHVVLVVEGVAGVALVAVHPQPVAVRLGAHAELGVLGEPVLTVDVVHVDAQRRAVVGRQPTDRSVAQPEFT